MSKGNPLLGFARGAVGDLVFSRQYGEQVVRARNRKPRNPQTPLQLLQRVVLKTTASAYSMMQDITNHSFQGFAEGTECQSEFTRRNVELFREQLADVINSGDAETILTSNETNFSMRGMTDVPINGYLVSDGTLQPLVVQGRGTGTGSSTSWSLGVSLVNGLPDGTTAQTVTYQHIVDALGLTRGDQITVLVVTIDDTDASMVSSVASGFIYGRIILEPNDGDMSSTFLVADADTGLYNINKPNERNDFDGQVDLYQSSVLSFYLNGANSASGVTNSIAAGTVIVSREVGGVWRRSRNRLIVRPSDSASAGHLQFDAQTLFLGDAVQSFSTAPGSLLYLNQAED